MTTADAKLRDASTIVLHQLYPFVTARLFIPSHRHGGPVSLATMHYWRIAGRIKTATYRPLGKKRRAWFMKGAEIYDLIGVEPAAAPPPASSRARASSIEKLRESGFKNV